MRKLAICLPIYFLVLTSCNSGKDLYNDAIANWSLADLNNQIDNSPTLHQHGSIRFAENKINGAYFDGSSWLISDPKQNDDLNITGNQFTMFARVKADTITDYNPIVNKSGNDLTIAYSLALRKADNNLYVEATIGSDDIGGAHLLKYLLPQDQWLAPHDILFRFNGKTSELIIDGVLRDNEITEGEIRNWNHSPLLIGAEYRYPYEHGDSAKNTIEHTFKGSISNVTIWNKYLPNERVAKLAQVDSITIGLPDYYNEKYRPQFHFTAKKNWINDPNGLVYFNGTYHLFFQYMPPNRLGAYIDWGHATSTDLVHWEQLPTHITPHKVWGGCWSGSAVVDHNNTAGFQTGKEKAIVAFITNGGVPVDGIGTACTQCIAYSTDGGNTFTYYDQNPVIKNINGANRDPKVVWDKQSKQWIMSLYMDKDNDFGLFGSSDLKKWEFLSTVSLPGVAECPGFEPLPVDGDSSKMKWLLFGANGNSSIGSFNGKKFQPETQVQIADYGRNFYAGQLWSDAPNNRAINIAWMPNQPYPGMPFEQQMNFPTEIKLKTTAAGVRMFRLPVAEINNLYEKEIKWNKTIQAQTENAFKDLSHDTYDMHLEIDLKNASSFDIGIRGATIHYDANKKRIYCGGRWVRSVFVSDDWLAESNGKLNDRNNMGEAPLAPVCGKIKLRILVDRTSIEIFGNDGEIALTSCFMPDDAASYTLKSNGEIEVSAVIHSLKSAWKNKQ